MIRIQSELFCRPGSRLGVRLVHVQHSGNKDSRSQLHHAWYLQSASIYDSFFLQIEKPGVCRVTMMFLIIRHPVDNPVSLRINNHTRYCHASVSWLRCARKRGEAKIERKRAKERQRQRQRQRQVAVEAPLGQYEARNSAVPDRIHLRSMPLHGKRSSQMYSSRVPEKYMGMAKPSLRPG